MLKKTEGVVTLVVCNPRKEEGGTTADPKGADKPKQPEKPSELDVFVFVFVLRILIFGYKLFCFRCMILNIVVARCMDRVAFL